MKRLGTLWEPTVGELAASIFCREFVPVYEPVVHLATGTVVGWNARGAWIHPSRGLLTSGEYSARAEQVGLLDAIDEIVVDRALRRFRRSSAGRFDPSDPWMSIALPGARLACGGLLEWLPALLGEYSIPPTHLVLEISQLSRVMHRAEVMDALDCWRDLGGSVAVQAEALGRRSLDMLISPVDVVKLDACQVRDVTDHGRGESCVATLVARAAQVGARVIAEGVTTDEQRRALTRLGCDAAQGPLIGDPDPELIRPKLPAHVA